MEFLGMKVRAPIVQSAAVILEDDLKNWELVTASDLDSDQEQDFPSDLSLDFACDSDSDTLVESLSSGCSLRDRDLLEALRSDLVEESQDLQIGPVDDEVEEDEPPPQQQHFQIENLYFYEDEDENEDEDEDEDEDDDVDDGLDDELVPRSVSDRFGRDRMRKLGKRVSTKMAKCKRSPYLYTRAGCVRGKHGLGLKCNF